MNATLPVNRIGKHYDSPPPAKPVLPKTARERAQLWSDIVFEAALTLRDQLESPIVAVAASAAHALIDLERTRMRHDKAVSGSATGSEYQREQVEREDQEEERERRKARGIVEDEEDEDEELSESEAFEEHVEELLHDYAKRGRVVFEDGARDVVTWCIRDWGLKSATAIPRGGFLAEMRRRGDNTKPEDFK